MKVLSRKSLLLLAALVVVAGAAFLANASSPDTGIVKPVLRALDPTVDCAAEVVASHLVDLPGTGKFETRGLPDSPPLVVKVGTPFRAANGLKTLPLQVIANGGHSFAEGIGEAHYWLDGSRPEPSAIWEKYPNTEFPAIQEVRFHFFYTVDALPGKIFRSINPAIMRSDDVRAFPPPPGTTYRLVEPVKLEDVSNPGVPVGSVLMNRLTLTKETAG